MKASRAALAPFLASLLTLLSASAFAAAPRGALSAEERARAQAELVKRLEGCPTPQDCTDWTAKIFLETPLGRPLWLVARERMLPDLQRCKERLIDAFGNAKPALQREILRVFEEGWVHVEAGVDFQIARLVKSGLASPDEDVRFAAAHLMATRPIWRVVHAAIDAADADPRLTLAALRAIEVTHDPLGTRWTIDQLSARDEARRRQALLTLRAIGQPAAERLRERLDAADPDERRTVMDAFLHLATFDDVPRLQTWLEAHGADDAELVQRVSTAIAELEAGRYAPAWPEAPPLGFD